MKLEAEKDFTWKDKNRNHVDVKKLRVKIRDSRLLECISISNQPFGCFDCGLK